MLRIAIAPLAALLLSALATAQTWEVSSPASAAAGSSVWFTVAGPPCSNFTVTITELPSMDETQVSGKTSNTGIWTDAYETTPGESQVTFNIDDTTAYESQTMLTGGGGGGAALLPGGVTQTTNGDDGPLYEGETWSGTLSGTPGAVVTVFIQEGAQDPVLQTYTVTLDENGMGYWKYPLPVGLGERVLFAKPVVNGQRCPSAWSLAVVAEAGDDAQDPDRFVGTDGEMDAMGTLTISFTDMTLPPGAQVTVLVYSNAGWDFDAVTIEIDVTGTGTVQWQIPAAWDWAVTSVNLVHPNSQTHTVQVQ